VYRMFKTDIVWIFSPELQLTKLLFICSNKPMAPSNVLSMAQLRTLPLADQIKILMKNGL